MTRTITLLLISLSVLLPLIAARSVEPLCSEGKVYDLCGTSCPRTCDNREPICTGLCVPGCVCGSGTVDNGLGECVDIVKCDICSGNTTHISCGRRCPPKINEMPVFCPAVCVEMCVCKRDYVPLPGSNRCVLPQDLPKSGYNV